MMNQIYKSIPLSVHVRLKASAKIIGALFIAFTSVEAYTTNNEIEIHLDHKDAESKGYNLNSLFIDQSTIYHYLPEYGYELDDDGNKHLLNQDDHHGNSYSVRFISDLETLKRVATHPYIFEYVFYLSFLRKDYYYAMTLLREEMAVSSFLFQSQRSYSSYLRIF